MTLGYSTEIAVGEKASDNEVSEPPSVAHPHYYIYTNINNMSYYSNSTHSLYILSISLDIVFMILLLLR